MSHAQVSKASSDFVCSWTTGGLDAGWVHHAGELDTGSSGDVEIVPGGPPA